LGFTLFLRYSHKGWTATATLVRSLRSSTPMYSTTGLPTCFQQKSQT